MFPIPPGSCVWFGILEEEKIPKKTGGWGDFGGGVETSPHFFYHHLGGEKNVAMEFAQMATNWGHEKKKTRTFHDILVVQ